MRTPRTVLIAGSSGLIGQALRADLLARGDRVRTLVRRDARTPDEASWDPKRGTIDPAAFEGVDAVVNLAGAPIGTRRWTSSYKQTILESRLRTTGLLTARLAELPDAPPLLQASAVGFYGDRGTEELTERSGPGTGFLADVVQQWENATRPAQEAGVRVVHLRTGIVLSRHGGALAPLLRLLRLGLGGLIGSGQQIWSWISIADHIAAIEHLIGSAIEGPVNLTAPAPVTNRVLIRALASELRRPAALPAPAFALRIVLGGFADDILGSASVSPEALRHDGFVFVHPDVQSATHWVTRQQPR